MIRDERAEPVLRESSPGAKRASSEAPAFDPERHRDALRAIIDEIASANSAGTHSQPMAPAEIDRILRRHPRNGCGFFSRAELIAGYRHLATEARLPIGEREFLARARLRPIRSQSGVTPVTVLTRPFPCPGQCVFCPSDARMPKSYLADEPGAQRAAANDFDPYLQTWNRLAAYRAIGHPVNKIELIVLGGSWTAYPEAYRLFFVKRCFDALDEFGRGLDRREEVRAAVRGFGRLVAAGSAPVGRHYNEVVSAFVREQLNGAVLADAERASWSELQASQRSNEGASCRCVGLALETRPDEITRREVIHLRRLGATKVQIGIQSLSDAILSANRRGHDVGATRRAMALLRAAGFKIHAHWMPNLLGASGESDIEDFERLFDDADFRPDELKIYPCSLVESADLVDCYRRGEWRPYRHEELLEVLVSALSHVPRYCRITRVVRDISSDDIVVGNKLTNFRQIAERELARRGGRCCDIRSREIRSADFDVKALRLETTRYRSSLGKELFLEYVTPEDRIVAFLRLSLPECACFMAEIERSALLREVHVYGAAMALGHRDARRAQHRGLGGKLIERAAAYAREAGYADLAVISAVGTRRYYRRLGFSDGALYQHRSLRAPEAAGAPG